MDARVKPAHDEAKRFGGRLRQARRRNPRPPAWLSISIVTAGLDPAVHAEPPRIRKCRMDARVQPAHDEEKDG
jgi:hypothetical protein